MTVRPLPRMLALLRRIADALDRIAPPSPRQRHPVDFTISTAADFERGYDERSRDDTSH